MDDGVLRFFEPSEAPGLRRRYVESAIARWAAPTFEKFPQLKTLGLWVSQIYNDEASDEVQAQAQFSQLEQPAPHNYPTGRKTGNPNLPDASYEEKLWRMSSSSQILDWSGMYWCIPMFSCFAPELDDTYAYRDVRNFGLAAVLRRTDDGFTMDPEPEPIRPWLVGVVPSYQQDESLEDVRANFDHWLSWVENDTVEWPAEAAPQCEALLTNLEQLLALNKDLLSAAAAESLSNNVERFLTHGPRPYTFEQPTFRNSLMNHHGFSRESRPHFEAIETAFEALTKLMPPPPAAYRS